MQQAVFELLVDTRVVHAHHWSQFPPQELIDYVRRRMRNQVQSMPYPYPSPAGTYIPEVDYGVS